MAEELEGKFKQCGNGETSAPGDTQDNDFLNGLDGLPPIAPPGA